MDRRLPQLLGITFLFIGVSSLAYNLSTPVGRSTFAQLPEAPIYTQDDNPATHQCPDQVKKGDYNCDNSVNYDDFTIYERDYKRADVGLVPYYEWIRLNLLDITPTNTPTGAPSNTPLPTTSATNTPDPTVPPSSQVDESIRKVIAEIKEDNVRTYMQSIVDNDSLAGTDELQTRYTGKSGNEIEAAYAKKFFEDNDIEVALQPFTAGSVRSNNVIAKLYGTDRSKWYLATAHLDSRAESQPHDPAPGADDNGSGSVAVMEIARAIKASGVPLQKSLEFILFSGEEQGLYGSRYYVRNIQSDKKINAVINMDMIGNKGTSNNCVNFNYYPRSGGNVISDLVMDVNRKFGIGLTGRSRADTISSSDHGPFWSAGNYMAIFAFECTFSPVYHSTNDTTQHLSLTQITKTAQAVAGALIKMSHEGQGGNLVSSDVLAAESDITITSSEALNKPAPSVLGFVTYTENTDLDRLHSLTTAPITFIQNDDMEEKVFIGLFSDSDITRIQKAGYVVQQVSTDIDISHYVLLWHPATGQGEKISYLGEVTDLAPHYYLLHLAADKKFVHEGPAAAFFDMELPSNLALPPFKTTRITQIPTPKVTLSDAPQSQKSWPLPILTWLLPIGFIAAGLIFLFGIRRKVY